MSITAQREEIRATLVDSQRSKVSETSRSFTVLYHDLGSRDFVEKEQSQPILRVRDTFEVITIARRVAIEVASRHWPTGQLRNALFLEFGVHHGESTVALADALELLPAADPRRPAFVVDAFDSFRGLPEA